MAIFGEFVPPSPGSQGQNLQSGSSGEVSRWGVIANVKTVALSGANYTSVKAACDAVAALGPSAVSPWHIKVSPGVYNELPFTIPQYTIVEGAGEQETVIYKNSNAVHTVTLEPGSQIRKCAVFGASNAGQAAIRRVTADPQPSYVVSVLIRGGYYGVLCDPVAALADIKVSLTGFDPKGDDIQEFIRVTGFGSVECGDVQIHGIAADIVHKGFVCDGANAKLTINAGCVYDSVGGTDGVYVNNSGTVIGLAVLLENGGNAIHVGAGGASFVAIHGSMIRGLIGGFTHDILIDSAAASVHYTGSLSRSRIDNAVGATDFLVSATNIEAGDDLGFTILGGSHLGPDITHMTPLLDYGQATWLTGLVSGGGVYRGGGLVINVDAGTGFINDGLHAHHSSWGNGHVDLAGNSEEYIYIDLAGVLQHSVVQPSYASNIVLGQAKTNAADVVILTQDEVSIVHSQSRLQEYLEDIIGPIHLSGGATTANAHALKLDVDGGTFMVGLSERTFVAATEVTWVYWYRLGGGLVWTAITAQDHVDDSQYNNAGALAALGGGAWKKDLLFVVVNHGGVEYHVVYGQETFASQAAAEAGAYPVAPEILTHYGMRSGGIVVEGAVAHIDSIVDARPHIGQFATTGAAGVHAALAGLAADDHNQYLNTARADLWLAAKAPEALVTDGDTHDHTGGAGAQIDHDTLSNNGGAASHTALAAHIIDFANPHGVTAAQAGAAPTTRLITSGAGLTGGGDLSADRTLVVGANADGSIIVNADDVQVGVLATDAQHGVRGGGTQHAEAVAGVSNGFMTAAMATRLAAIVFGDGYQYSAEAARTTITGVNSNVYAGLAASTKLSLVIPALPAGTYKLAWSAVVDYSAINREFYIRIQNTTDATTLWEGIYRPSIAAERNPISGMINLAAFAGSKTIDMQFRTNNTGDTAGVAYATLEIHRVS